jgi:hypothetical protein
MERGAGRRGEVNPRRLALETVAYLSQKPPPFTVRRWFVT